MTEVRLEILHGGGKSDLGFLESPHSSAAFHVRRAVQSVQSVFTGIQYTPTFMNEAGIPPALSSSTSSVFCSVISPPQLSPLPRLLSSVHSSFLLLLFSLFPSLCHFLFCKICLC